MNHTFTDLATEDTNDSTPFALLVDVLDLILAFTEQSQSIAHLSTLLHQRHRRNGQLLIYLFLSAYVEQVLPLTCIAAILDMQTISGCFHIFAYLESRFDRLTAVRSPDRTTFCGHC